MPYTHTPEFFKVDYDLPTTDASAACNIKTATAWAQVPSEPDADERTELITHIKAGLKKHKGPPRRACAGQRAEAYCLTASIWISRRTLSGMPGMP